jgi:hypothetical protein
MIKSPAQYWAGNRPWVTARKAWQPVTHGRLSRGLTARSSRAAAYAHARLRAQHASAAWSLCAGWRGGVFADFPTVANWRRGAPREHQ